MQDCATNKKKDEEVKPKALPEVKKTMPFEVEIYTVPQSSPKEGTPSVRRPLSRDESDQSIVTKRRRFGEAYHAWQAISPIVVSHDISYLPLSYLSQSGLQNKSTGNVSGAIIKAITSDDQAPVESQTNSFQGTAPTEISGPQSKNSSSQVVKPLVYRDGLRFEVYHDSDRTEPSGPEEKELTDPVAKPPVYRDGLPFNIYHDSDGTEPSGPEANEPQFHEAEILYPSDAITELINELQNPQLLDLSPERMEVERSPESIPAEVIIKQR